MLHFFNQKNEKGKQKIEELNLSSRITRSKVEEAAELFTRKLRSRGIVLTQAPLAAKKTQVKVKKHDDSKK